MWKLKIKLLKDKSWTIIEVPMQDEKRWIENEHTFPSDLLILIYNLNLFLYSLNLNSKIGKNILFKEGSNQRSHACLFFLMQPVHKVTTFFKE